MSVMHESMACPANPHFPIITPFLTRARNGVQLHEPDPLQDLLRAVFKAMRIDALNFNEPELTAKELTEGGFNLPPCRRWQQIPGSKPH